MLLILSSILLGGALSAAPVEDFDAATSAWRAQREEALRRPNGWLSLVGLHWVAPGIHRVGHAPDRDIVLAAGPDQLGTLRVESEKVLFTPAAGIDTRIEGAAVQAEVELRSDRDGPATLLEFDQGQASLQVIERGGRYALRVRDARAATRTNFAGLDYFAIDPTWRVEARFEPHPPGSTIPIANVIGQLEPMSNPGAVVFERDGREYRLEAVDEGDGQLFLIFADRTSGRETYGAGRFLYAAPAQDGRTVLDFNRAYSPPCAFNAYSTCPLPPPGNRLDLAVTAGEKKYGGTSH